MKKLILAVTLLALSAGITMGADMIAGNPKNGANVVGTVDVSVVPPNLVVTYTITDLDWIITETHLHIATDPEGFPTSKGGAIPGHFDYSMSFDVADNQQVVIHTIPLVDIFEGGIVPDVFFVAAHAVVGTLCPCDSAVCEELDLPAEVGLSVLWAGDFTPNRTESYFLATVFGGTVLDGDYDAYCVDTDRSIRPQGLGRGIPLQALVYCECDDVPWLDPPNNPLIEYCDNMDLVVWILDNINVGDPSTGCTGNYTMGDIQKAIWLLLDDTVDDSGLGDWSQCRVDEIIAAAEAEGEGFEPICGEYFGVILLPYVYMIDTTVPADGIPDVVLVDGTTGDPIYDNFPPDTVPILVYVQPIVIKIPAPCCFCDETAWAGTPVEPSRDWPDEDNDGYKYEFPGKDWSMYFSVPEDAEIAEP